MLRSLWRTRERLLRKNGNRDSFPARQLFVLSLCRICEPIAFMSIFPYAYRMIETFDTARDPDRISIYAGLLITSFAFAEFCSGVLWGHISDSIGRRPVLIFGLVGTALSMIIFGFAKNLQTAIIARALGGLLNGNVGVLQTTVAELVTVKEHEPLAFSIMPFVWCLGSIIGPALGGALAQPCESYPWLFDQDSIFHVYPFLLPNLVCFIVLLLGIANGIAFLEETHPEKKHLPGWGRSLGVLLHQRGRGITTGYLKGKPQNDRHDVCENNEQPPRYQSTTGSARLSSVAADSSRSSRPRVKDGPDSRAGQGITKIFTKQVILVITAYGILAFHGVSFDILVPLLLSEPRSHEKPQLPFKFTGGFALSTKTIGLMMAVQGVYSLVAQLILFPWLVRRWGTLRTFQCAMLLWPLLYFVVPYLVLVPAWLQQPGIYACLLVKVTFHVIAFPSTAILLTNAAPSTLVLGSINGVAASIACLSRAMGPAVTGLLHTWGLKIGYNGIGWWNGGLICAIGALQSFWMEDVDCRTSRASEEVEQPACEPLLRPSVVEDSGDDLLLRESLDSLEELGLAKAWEG